MGMCSNNISRTYKEVASWVLHCHGTEDINYQTVNLSINSSLVSH